MKAKDLRELLADVPDEMEVAIFDWRKNMNWDTGDGDSVGGIYTNFYVEEYKERDIPEGTEPWVALSYENEDFDQDGIFISEYDSE